MDFQINQNDITQKITDELLKEIKESGATFTPEEIKEKINDKLDEFFREYEREKSDIKRIEEEEKEKNIKSEFTDIEDFMEEDDDKFDSLLETVKNKNLNLQEENQENELLKDVESENCNDKKNFFKEFTVLYKSELENSINSFKNAFETFKLMKKTSIIEKVVILLFLAIPAIFAGFITLLFVLILLLLWQIHILLNVFAKFFDKIESSLKETITKIKKKIEVLKNSGGFFNRLIFSNSLYSLIMFNGILYMLVKGIVLPLRSAMEIDRILANLASRGVKLVTTTLRGPSELALANLRGTPLGASKTKTKGTTKGRDKLNLKEKNKLKLNNQLKEKQKQKNDKIKERDVNAIKFELVKDKIAKDIAKKLEVAQNQRDPLERKNTIEERIETLMAPSSSKLSNTETVKDIKDDLGKIIFDSVLDSMRDRIFNMEPSKQIENLGNILKNNVEKVTLNNRDETERLKNEVISNDAKATQDGVNMAGETISQALNIQNNDINNIIQEQCHGYNNGEINISDMVNNVMENTTGSDGPFTEDQKLETALGIGQMMDSVDDRQSHQLLEEYKNSHPDATATEIAQKDLEFAKADLRGEIEQFRERYGEDPQKLIAEKMEERGIDADATLTNEQLIDITKEIVKEKTDLTEEEKLGMMKDFGEYAGAFIEKERTKEQVSNTLKEELQINKSNSITNHSHVDSINRESGGRGIDI